MSVLTQGRRTRTTLCGGIAAAVLALTGTASAMWPASATGAASAKARTLSVTSLSAVCGNRQIDLEWTTSDDLPFVTGFDVHKSVDGGAWMLLGSPAATGAGPYALFDTDLKAAGTYTYRVTVTTQQSSWTAFATTGRTVQKGQRCV